MVTINGRKISQVHTRQGNNVGIVIQNGEVFVNGEQVNTENDKQISITIEGNVSKLDVDVCEQLQTAGSAGSISTASGDIHCGSVEGSVRSMSGDVIVNGSVHGSVSTMSGDVIRR